MQRIFECQISDASLKPQNIVQMQTSFFTTLLMQSELSKVDLCSVFFRQKKKTK